MGGLAGNFGCNKTIEELEHNREFKRLMYVGGHVYNREFKCTWVGLGHRIGNSRDLCDLD